MVSTAAQTLQNGKKKLERGLGIHPCQSTKQKTTKKKNSKEQVLDYESCPLINQMVNS